MSEPHKSPIRFLRKLKNLIPAKSPSKRNFDLEIIDPFPLVPPATSGLVVPSSWAADKPRIPPTRSVPDLLSASRYAPAAKFSQSTTSFASSSSSDSPPHSPVTPVTPMSTRSLHGDHDLGPQNHFTTPLSSPTVATPPLPSLQSSLHRLSLSSSSPDNYTLFLEQMGISLSSKRRSSSFSSPSPQDIIINSTTRRQTRRKSLQHGLLPLSPPPTCALPTPPPQCPQLPLPLPLEAEHYDNDVFQVSASGERSSTYVHDGHSFEEYPAAYNEDSNDFLDLQEDGTDDGYADMEDNEETSSTSSESFVEWRSLDDDDHGGRGFVFEEAFWTCEGRPTREHLHSVFSSSSEEEEPPLGWIAEWELPASQYHPVPPDGSHSARGRPDSPFPILR